jgi:prephenate dehydratase
MHFLNNLRKNTNLTTDTKDNITRYQVIHKRVIREAKKRENDKYVLNAKNKTKAMWQIINKEIGKSPQYKQKIELKMVQKITNPHNVAEKSLSFFLGGGNCR